MKRPVMYLFLNRGLGMSTGKAAAQVAHAACEAMILSPHEDVDAWRTGGHYTKIVLDATDSVQLDTIERYLQDRGFKTTLIIDEGRTEIEKFSKTALGVAIVDKSEEHVIETFSSFDLYPKNDLTTKGYEVPDRYLSRAGKREKERILEYLMKDK